MDARETVRSYYDALRDGEPLGPYFAAGRDAGDGDSDGNGDGDDGDGDDDRDGDDGPVKFGISETLVGTDEIRSGLAEQTETTTGWTVDSRALRVTERDRHAWFSDDVFLAWTDTDRGIRFEFDTRWSGTLERRAGDRNGGADAGGEPDGDGPAWQFVGTHVSTADDL